MPDIARSATEADAMPSAGSNRWTGVASGASAAATAAPGLDPPAGLVAAGVLAGTCTASAISAGSGATDAASSVASSVSMTCGFPASPEGDLGASCTLEAERDGGGPAHVDDIAGPAGETVVDAQRDRAPGLEVLHDDLGAEREARMRRGERPAVEPLAARGAPPVETRAVP